MSINNIFTTGSLVAKQLNISNVLHNFTQVRFRKLVSFRAYRQPHYRQKLLLNVCQPYKAPDRRPDSEKCYNLTPLPSKPDHPYDVLLAKEMKADFETASLVCFFHQNQMKNWDKKDASNRFEHEGMTLRFYNKDIARLCWANTPFASLLHFVAGKDFTILFAPNTDKISKIISITKKSPELILLGALVDHRRLLKLKQMEEFSKISNLDAQRAMLCYNLTLVQQNLLQSLNHHSSQLSQLLSTHANPSNDSK